MNSSIDVFAKIMSNWEEVLNSDAELEERNKSIYSSLKGRVAIQLEVEGQPSYIVDISGGKFKVHQGSAASPLISWNLPVSLFKDVMLGKQRLIYGLLDSRGTLSFDTPSFTHWNGATIIEMLFLASEMSVKNSEVSKLVEVLGN
ncbi:MAG: hypothetical protein KAR43_08365 [Deltaproteobacteria bacterium]|nr:hypothetical protein [Deltaproteobacteria bacterium]